MSLGFISNTAGSPGTKDATLAFQPLLLATITFTNGTVLRLSTHPLSLAEGGFQYKGQDYLARLLDQNIDAVQGMSETGIDIPPTITLQIADADRYLWTNYEATIGFKGADINLDLVLWQAGTGNFSADSYRKFTGVCNSPNTDENTLTVSATSKLNMQKVLLPIIPVQTRCPWLFPPDLPSRIAGESDSSSSFFPCGYSPDVAGGFGNLSTPNQVDASGFPLTDATGVFVQCGYTRADCTLRGMFSQDSSGKKTGHFGGVEWDPPLWWKSKSYLLGKDVSGINAPNDQRYSDYVPLVYGQVFVDGVVLDVIGDANSTRMEVLICFGDVGTGSSTSTGGVKKVIVNGVLVPFNYPPGGPALVDKLFRWQYVNSGTRDSSANNDAGYSNSPGVPFSGLGDPYGNLCVIEIVVPTVLVGSQTVPQVQVLTVGPAMRVYDSPSTYSLASVGPVTGQGNPIWILMDLLVRANWSYSQLNIQSFIDAAAVCDVPINYTDNAGVLGNTNVDGSPHVRYSCSLQITRRRTAAEIIQGVRNCCKAMLVPNDQSGLLQVFIKQTLADQQPRPIVGSNNGDPVSSITAARGSSSGYSAFDFDESSILVNENGASTLKITQRTVLDSPNSISANFQDQDNQFVVDSMTELDPVDVARAGQTVSGGLQIDGLNSFDQGQRAFETRFAETFRGNPRGDSGGTLLFTFQTTQKIAHLQVGMIGRFSHQQLNLTFQKVRVISIQLSRDFEMAQVQLQWHEDFWYTNTYGQIGNPIYSGNNKQQLTRPPFAWQPDWIGPLLSDPMFDPTNFTFGMGVQYNNAADGTAVATLTITGLLPVNSFATLQAPLIALEGNSGSVPGTGNIAPGVIVHAVICPYDASTPAKFAPPELIPCVIAIPPGISANNTATIPIGSWPPGAMGYDVFAGPNALTMTFQATGTGTPSSITLTSLNAKTFGPPDVMFDHITLRVKQQIHGGVWGLAVSAVTSTTLQFAGQNFGPGQWAGYTLTITGQALNPGPLPVWNFLIAGNSADTLTVDPSTPDLVSGLSTGVGTATGSGGSPGVILAGVKAGDAAVMRCLPSTFTATTIGDQNFINSVAPNGLTPNEGNYVVRLVSGTGAGQWRNVIGNSSTVYTIDKNTPFFPVPDASTRFWIEAANWQPGVDSSQAQNSNINAVYTGTLDVTNYDEESIVVQALTMDSQENSCIEQYAPIRDFFLFGEIGALGLPQAVFIFGRSNTGGAADLVLGGTTNLVIVQTAGTLNGWQAVAQTAPVGSAALFDILLNGTSVFGILGTPVTIPDGSTSLQTGDKFAPSNTLNSMGQAVPGIILNPGDLLQGVILQVGASSAGQSVTVNLYWK